MVLEADAYALVITAANGPRLVRLGALMIDAFCTVRETAEENDG